MHPAAAACTHSGRGGRGAHLPGLQVRRWESNGGCGEPLEWSISALCWKLTSLPDTHTRCGGQLGLYGGLWAELALGNLSV